MKMDAMLLAKFSLDICALDNCFTCPFVLKVEQKYPTLGL
jgi:hypothetical protein